MTGTLSLRELIYKIIMKQPAGDSQDNILLIWLVFGCIWIQQINYRQNIKKINSKSKITSHSQSIWSKTGLFGFPITSLELRIEMFEKVIKALVPFVRLYTKMIQPQDITE